MRVKTSVTLDEGTLRAIDEIAEPGGSRSAFIEEAVTDYVDRRRRELRDERDRRLLDRLSDDLNEEVEDVLEYQSEAEDEKG